MSDWPLAIHLQPSDEPLFRQIAAAISTDIERSRLRPGERLPSSRALTRRQKLLELATRERLIIFEDNYDYDFHYDETPLFPLAASDRSGVVIYFGTMSKTLAPGLRLGYTVAPPAAIDRMAAYRTYVDTQGDHVLEEAVATLLEDGVVQRHADRALRAYRKRRDFLCGVVVSSLVASHNATWLGFSLM